jgi:hypothetical protein
MMMIYSASFGAWPIFIKLGGAKNGKKRIQPWRWRRRFALTKFLHPSALIRENYPNPVPGYRAKDLITKRQEVKNVNRKPQLCLVFSHDDYPDISSFIASSGTAQSRRKATRSTGSMKKASGKRSKLKPMKIIVLSSRQKFNGSMPSAPLRWTAVT